MLGTDSKKQEESINKLRTRINAFGYNQNIKHGNYYYMSDGHIWDLLDDFSYDEQDLKKLSFYLELLLKYDWERSKNEVKVDNIFFWNIFVRWCLIGFNLAILIWLIVIQHISSNHYLILLSLLISIICLSQQKKVISILSKVNYDLPRKEWIFITSFIFIFLFPYFNSIFHVYHLLWYFGIDDYRILYIFFPIVLSSVILVSEINILIQINNLDQKYIAKIKSTRKNQSILEIKYNRLYNEIYLLKEENFLRRIKSIKTKDVEKLERKVKKMKRKKEHTHV